MTSIEFKNLIKPKVYSFNLVEENVGRKICIFLNNTFKIIKLMPHGHGDASGILQEVFEIETEYETYIEWFNLSLRKEFYSTEKSIDTFFNRASKHSGENGLSAHKCTPQDDSRNDKMEKVFVEPFL